MKLQAPARLRSRLSLYLTMALVGLITFAAVVLVADPSQTRTSGGGALGASAAPSSPSRTSQASPWGDASGGQGYLLSGASGSVVGSAGRQRSLPEYGVQTDDDGYLLVTMSVIN